MLLQTFLATAVLDLGLGWDELIFLFLYVGPTPDSMNHNNG